MWSGQKQRLTQACHVCDGRSEVIADDCGRGTPERVTVSRPGRSGSDLPLCAGDVGFHKGRPLAAMVIFRCCLQWKAFQADRTSLFDKIINTMGSQARDADSRRRRTVPLAKPAFADVSAPTRSDSFLYGCLSECKQRSRCSQHVLLFRACCPVPPANML